MIDGIAAQRNHLVIITDNIFIFIQAHMAIYVPEFLSINQFSEISVIAVSFQEIRIRNRKCLIFFKGVGIERISADIFAINIWICSLRLGVTQFNETDFSSLTRCIICLGQNINNPLK